MLYHDGARELAKFLLPCTLYTAGISRITIQSKSIDKTVATVDRLALASALTSSPTAVPVVGLVTIAPEGAALSADREAGAREQG